MISSLRPATYQNLQLNAGVFLANFDASSYADADALEDAIIDALEDGTNILGATIGGGTFTAEPTMRQIEADGVRYAVIGSTVNDMWTIKLATTLKEVTPENFQRALVSCDIDTSKPSVKTLTVRTGIKDSDYIPKLSWVGDTSKGFVMIELDNALNLSGASFTFTDKGEGTLPVEFQAHHSELKNVDKAPFRIHFFDRRAS